MDNNIEVTQDEVHWLLNVVNSKIFMRDGELTVAGMLRLMRRRSGLGLREAADAAHTTHVTYLAWERSGDDRLVRFWFPPSAPEPEVA
jgi:hypothetical protein